METTRPLDQETISAIDEGRLSIDLPDDFLMPPELAGVAPRRIPDEFYQRRQVRRPSIIGWILIAIGVASLIAGAKPWGGPWRQIGFYVGVIPGLMGFVVILMSRRDLKYVQDAVVGSGRILKQTLVPAADYNGETIALKHVLLLGMELSDGTLTQKEFSGLQVDANGGPRAHFRVGDVLPLVWFPGRFEKTVIPYPFLNFRRDDTLVRNTGETNGWLKKLGTAVAVIAIFAVLIGNLFLLMRCVPVGMNVPVVIAIGIGGAVFLGGAIFWVTIGECRRSERRRQERNKAAEFEHFAAEVGASHALLTNTLKGWMYRIAVGAGSLLMGGLSLVLWSFGANQFFDQSPPQNRVIEILGVRQTGGNSPRTELTFRPIDEPNAEYSREYVPRDLPKFPLIKGQRAQAEWHTGAFGWPWIGELRPAPRQ